MFWWLYWWLWTGIYSQAYLIRNIYLLAILFFDFLRQLFVCWCIFFLLYCIFSFVQYYSNSSVFHIFQHDFVIILKMVEFVRWKLSWCCMFVQVLRVLVKLYFNLQTPDYISVSQVLHFSDFGFFIFNYFIFQMTNSVSIYWFQICSKSTLKLNVLGVFITNFELIPEEIFTSSKSTIETLVKGVKYVQS